MRILLTGGTGFIGRPLVAALMRDGHAAVTLSRRHTPPLDWPAGAELLPWSGPPSAIPQEALAGVDAVINLAGASIGEGRWTKRRKDLLFSSRILTTRALVDRIAVASARPKVLISASAVGYYGSYDNDGAEFTEAARPGSDFLATLCSHWEDEARKIVRHGVRLCLLRFGVVLDRDGGALPRMMLPFKFGAGGPVGSGQQVISWIHRADTVGLIRFALATERFSGPINATAPEPVQSRQFATLLGRAMHRPAFMPTPAFALRLALGEMADLALRGQRVLPTRALEFGYPFRYPDLEAALRAILGRNGIN
jgi:hypothetical protein